MPLSLDDLTAMVAGFREAGFRCVEMPGSQINPVPVEVQAPGGPNLAFRLWCFEITHGGGGPTVRAADEYRIQITNGPAADAGLDAGGAIDLVIGFSRGLQVIVAYDRRWMEKWMQNGGGSPSVQVREADIQAALAGGMHRVTKAAGFGEAGIITMRPHFFPAYLADHAELLSGRRPVQAAIQHAPDGDDSVWQYCAARGFVFDPDLLARYIAALATKPFAILAGVSGTGKSKMAELVAEYYSRNVAPGHGPELPRIGGKFAFVSARGTPDRTRFALVPVRPDWIDNQSVLGFVNPIVGAYQSTQTLDLLLRADRALSASANADLAPRYFLLLDEMNLARVEHYFSDFLACTESRRREPDGTVRQQPVPLHRLHGACATLDGGAGGPEDLEVPQSLGIPTNLVVTGTVNVDETTYGFSPKVLDRAMVLEFDAVVLEDLRSPPAVGVIPDYRFPESFPPFRLASPADYAALSGAMHGHLSAINRVLEGARLHFGYRAATEIALFVAVHGRMLPAGLGDAERDLRSLDAAVLQKVLPRIQGNRPKVEPALVRLTRYLRDLAEDDDGDDPGGVHPARPPGLPLSHRRALEMLDALRAFGFVSFFK